MSLNENTTGAPENMSTFALYDDATMNDLNTEFGKFWENSSLDLEDNYVRDYPHTLKEIFSRECENCFKAPIICSCYRYSDEIMIMGDLLTDWVINQGYKPMKHGQRTQPSWVVVFWNNLLEQRKPGNIIGFTRPSKFGSFKFYYYGDEMPRLCVRRQFGSFEEALLFIVENIVMFEIMFRTVKSKVEKVEAQSQIKNVSQPLERSLPGVPKLKVKVVVKKKLDYDNKFFKLALNSDAKSKPNRRLEPPESMKMEFALHQISKFIIAESMPKTYTNLPSYRNEPSMSNTEPLFFEDKMDALLYEIYRYSVQNGTYEGVDKKLEMLTKGSGILGECRREMYHLALARKRGIQLPKLSNLTVDPYRMRYQQGADPIFGIENMRVTEILMMENVPWFSNYRRYLFNWHAFRRYMRRSMSYATKIPHDAFNLTIIAGAYVRFCTNHHLTFTMFSGMKETASSVENAANKIAGIDVDRLNIAIENLATLTLKGQSTVDNMSRLFSKENGDKVDTIVSGMANIFEEPTSILTGLSNFLTDSIKSQLSSFLGTHPILDKALSKITVSNMISLTVAYVIYNHSESMLVKSMVVVYVMKQFGLMDFIMQYFSKFITACTEGAKSFYNAWVPTSITSVASSLIGCFSSGFKSILCGIITVMGCISKVTIPLKVVRKIVGITAQWGRDCHFLNAGLNALPNLIDHFKNAMSLTWAWITGKQKPKSAQSTYETEFNEWAHRVYLLSSPNLLDVLRTQKQLRDLARPLYDEGVALYKKLKDVSDPTRIMPRLTAQLRVAKTLCEQVVRFEENAVERPTPFHFVLESAPGVGKTNLTHLLAAKFKELYWPQLDTTALMYNVPVNNEYFDNYTKQPIMILDDYNMINDPVIASKMIYLVSNLPMILPMANLDDKGMINCSEVIISTTNNAYHVADGINCHGAFLRRRQHVAHITVPEDCMLNGNVNREKVIKYYKDAEWSDLYKNAAFRQSVETWMVAESGFTIAELKDAQRYNQWVDNFIKVRAQDYYEKGDFYKIKLKQPKVDKPMENKTYDLQAYVEYLLKEFATYRASQRELLQNVNKFEIDTDTLLSMVHIREELEKRKLEAEELKTRLAAVNRTPLENEQEIINGLPKILKMISLLTSNISSTVLNTVGIDRLKLSLMTAPSTSEVIDEALAEQLATLEATANSDESDDESFDQEQPSTSTAGLNFEPTAGYFETNSTPTRVRVPLCDNRSEVYLPPIDSWAESDDVVGNEEPRFGWFPHEYHLDAADDLLIHTRLANDFVMRLFLVDPRGQAVTTVNESALQLIEDMELTRNDCYHFELQYALDEQNLLEYHRMSNWMRESISTFSAMSLSDRLNLALVGREMARVIHTINNTTTPVSTATRAATVQQTPFQTFLKTLSKFVTELALVALITVLYVVCYLLILTTIGWLFSNKPAATSTIYNVQPKKVGLGGSQKLSWYQTGSYQTIRDQRKKYRANMGIARVNEDNWFGCRVGVANFTYVKANIALFPRHFVYALITGEKQEMVIETSTNEGPEQSHVVTREDIYSFDNCDACLIVLRSGTLRYRDMTKAFVQEKQVPFCVPSQVIIHQKEPDSGCILAARSDIIDLTDVQLSGCEEKLRSLVYRGSVEKGTSGGLAMIETDAFPTTIIGCQSAATREWGAVAVVTREMLEEAYATLQPFAFEELPETFEHVFEPTQLTEVKIQNTQILKIFKHPDIVALAGSNEIPHLATKTDLHPTPIACALEGNGKEPAILQDRDHRIAQRHSDKPHFLTKSVNKFCSDMMVPLRRDEMHECVQGHVMMYKNSRQFETLKVRSFEESLTGLPLPGYRKMNTNTSPGLPWVLPSHHKKVQRGKKDFFLFNEQGELEYATDELRSSVEELKDKLSHRIIPNLRMMDTLKDELRDATLGRENTTRIVTVLPMQVNILLRMYCMDLWAAVHRLATRAYPISVGINITSHHVQLMLRKIQHLDGGAFCFDFDISNWDGHMSPDYFAMLLQTESLMYRDSPQDAIVREGLYNYIQFGLEQISGVIVKKYRGMPSGTAGTAENNSRAHSKLLYIAYRRIMLREGRDSLASFGAFLEHVVYYVYGDDIVVAVSGLIVEIFNGITVSQEYAKLGWPATPAVKGNEHVKYRHWSEIVFLKHKFIETPDGFTLALIEESTIQNLFLWMRGKDTDQFYQNLDDAFRFLAFYPREKFNHYLRLVNTALDMNYMRPISCDWTTLRRAILKTYYD